MDDIERLFVPNYIPTNQDILRARVSTTGNSDTVFDIGSYTLHFYRNGGQRSEREMLIHHIDNVQALCFVASIGGYDQSLAEDKNGVSSRSIKYCSQTNYYRTRCMRH
jgi:guanine nucleotide-binding protein subunit alpha, other